MYLSSAEMSQLNTDEDSLDCKKSMGYLIYINQRNQKLIRGWNDLREGDFLNTKYCLRVNQRHFVRKMR